MYEYKIETYKVKEAEKAMNELAKEGWRVVAVSPNEAMGFGLVVTYERKIDQRNSDYLTVILEGTELFLLLAGKLGNCFRQNMYYEVLKDLKKIT